MVTENGENNKNGQVNLNTVLGALGTYAFLNGGGAGNIIGGGNRPQPPAPATKDDLAYERQLTEKDAVIGQLKAEKYADAAVLAAERRFEDKLDAIENQINAMNNTQAVLNTKQTAFIEGLAARVAEFDRMTARYINGPVMAGSEALAAMFNSKAAGASSASSNNG